MIVIAIIGILAAVALTRLPDLHQARPSSAEGDRRSRAGTEPLVDLALAN